jgi:hypothetical protein
VKNELPPRPFSGREQLTRVARWSVLLIGLAVTIFLLVGAVYEFLVVPTFCGDYCAAIGLRRGAVLLCAAFAICLVAIGAFRQLPRIPRADLPAMLLLFLGVAIGLTPFAYGTGAKEICLSGHRPWNVTLMRCE